VNVGGKGDATTRDGIMVIQAVNGGTSDSGAFALNGRVAAGAYEYFLFKGGVTVGTEENWYLRSELVAPLPPPTPTPPPTPPPTPTPTPAPGTPDLPSPVPDGPPIPLYSIKVPTYAVIPPVARHLVLSTLGTFHERRGEQALLRGSGYLPASWGRVFGQDAEMKWDGTVAPSFDGNFFGFQVGEDLLSSESITGHFDHVGLFVGHARVQGDVKGQALGWNDLAVGNVGVRGNGLGGYWTHIGPQGWYLDGVLMGVWLSGDASADSGESIDSDGTGATASLEGGYPIALTQQWTLEPQAQLIWQHLSLDGQADRFSSVSFDTDDTLAGRLGSRLWGNFQTGTGTIQLYLKANLWHNFSADETVRFDGDPIVTELDGTSVEVGGGIVASLTENFSLFATADYTTNLGSEKTRILGGNLGASIKW
ncbi:MAG: autotransporter outer membrane beta-barrel domain-containing protein, partial [Pseudomonadota bacterium]